MHTQAERLDTGVQGMTVPLCYSVCSRLMKGGQPCCQVRTLWPSLRGCMGDVPWQLTWKLQVAYISTSAFFFLLLADCSLGGWMSEKIQGRSGKSRQFHFPSATLVQHQQAFHSLTYFGLYTNPPHETYLPYQRVSISINRGYVGFEIRQVVFRPPHLPHASTYGDTHQTFLLIWKAAWWVSTRSVRCWSERSGLSVCQPAAGVYMLRDPRWQRRDGLASLKHLRIGWHHWFGW